MADKSKSVMTDDDHWTDRVLNKVMQTLEEMLKAVEATSGTKEEQDQATMDKMLQYLAAHNIRTANIKEGDEERQRLMDNVKDTVNELFGAWRDAEHAKMQALDRLDQYMEDHDLRMVDIKLMVDEAGQSD